MPGARWFEGAELNYAENLLAPLRYDGGGGSGDGPRPSRADDVAVVHCSELRELDELTWGQLSAQVAAAAAGLRSLGVGRGDRVVAYMPNIPETLVAFLATASIGAIWSSAAPEFGARSVIDRFAQIEPKVLLASTATATAARTSTARPSWREIRAELPSVEHTVLLGYLDADAELDGAISWHELLAQGSGRGADASSRCRSTTRCGCSTPPARPACPRRSCRATAASWSSS